MEQQQEKTVLDQVVQGLTRLEGEQKAFREDHIKALAEMKATVMKEVEEKAARGYDSPETKAKIVSLETAISKMEADMLRPGSRQEEKSAFKTPGEQLADNKDFQEWKEGGFRLSKAIPHRSFAIQGGLFPAEPLNGLKATILSSNLSLPTVRQPGIIQLPRQELRIRDIMDVRPITVATIDFLKQNAFTNLASPQVEGAVKSESTVTYTTMSTTVRTLAHWVQVTKQALDDVPGLRADIDSLLLYGLKLKEEMEILAGDGTGVHLNGIVPQATAYATGTYNVAGDTKLDKLRHMILQCRLALFPCDGLILNPRDMHDLELIKDLSGGSANTGRYIIGDPRTGVESSMVWGKPVVESDTLTYGQALVGSFRSGAILYDRQMSNIDISFEHATNFTENEATIRAEERLALAVTRPASFVYGAL